MWPWSTIRKLRSDLDYAEKQRWRVAGDCGRLSAENEDLRQRWTALNESYEVMKADRDKFMRAESEARQESGQWENSYMKAHELWERAHDRESVLIAQNHSLQQALAEATKNDARDPKTGRFVKSVAQPGVTTMGESSGEVGH